MKKKGFTLIELLAVIVILAIIALIATPLVLKYIEKSRKESKVDSAYSFVRNLETEIANYSIKNNGKKYNKTGLVEISDFTDIDTTVKGDTPSNGKVCLSSLGQVEKAMFEYGKYYVIYDGKKGSISDKGMYDSFSCSGNFSVCTLAPEGDIGATGISIGDKYLCRVKENMEPEYTEGYTFYVISKNSDGTTNLIMDQNIYSDGTPAGMTGVTKEENNQKYSLVPWVSKEDYNDDTNYGSYGSTNKGPLTTVKFLYNATKDWVNIEPADFIYQDRLIQGILDSEKEGYSEFEIKNGIAKITSSISNEEFFIVGTDDYPIRTRLPIYTENQEYIDKNEVSLKNDNNLYLYQNLDSLGENPPYGYWTLSSHNSDYSLAWFVSFEGEVTASGPYDSDVSVYDYHGVRPIITVKI